MIDLTNKRLAYVRAMKKAVQRLRRDAATIPEIRRIVLFGSYPKGRRDLATDLDVLIEMDSDEDFMNRSARMRKRFRLGVDADLLAYSPEEMKTMSSFGFIRRALVEGEVIYERVSPK